MKIENIFDSYFNGLNALCNRESDSKNKVLGLLKVISYFTIIIPAAFVTVYIINSLCGRIQKKPNEQQKQTIEKINNISQKIQPSNIPNTQEINQHEEETTFFARDRFPPNDETLGKTDPKINLDLLHSVEIAHNSPVNVPSSKNTEENLGKLTSQEKQNEKMGDFLIQAIIDHDIDQVKKLFNGTSITGVKVHLPWHCAVREGQLEIIKIFLQHGADINAQDIKGRTALSLAAEAGRNDIVEFLFEKHADFIPDNNGSHAIHYAAQNGHVETVELLLKKEASINGKGAGDLTPLNFAAEMGHTKMVNFLVEKGANPNISNRFGKTTFHYAASNGHLEILKSLVKKNPEMIDTEDHRHNTPLIEACANGHTEIVKFLLDSKANIDKGNIKGTNPLFAAIARGKLEVMKLLINRDANLLVSLPTGWTPLHLAVRSQNIEVTQLLLEKKIIVEQGLEIKTSSGDTPLSVAAARGDVSIVKMLLDVGANPNILTKEAMSPLNSAQMYGNHEVAKLLYEKSSPEIRVWSDHKWMSHKFGIDIQVLKDGKELGLWAFTQTVTFKELADSVSSNQDWISQAPAWWSQDDTAAILDSLNLAAKLANHSINKTPLVEEALKTYSDKKALLIPVRIPKHAIAVSFLKSFIAFGDRALEMPHIYMGLIKNIANVNEVISKLISEKDKSSKAEYVYHEMLENLDLIIDHIDKKDQHGRICAWVAAKNGFEEILKLYIYQTCLDKGLNKEETNKTTIKMYKAWVKQDQFQSLKKYIQTVPEKDPHKENILGCLYHHFMQKKNDHNEQLKKLIDDSCPNAKKIASQFDVSEGVRLYSCK